MISRREILAYLALAPSIAWAQPAPGMHRIGVLTGGSKPDPKGRNFPAFLESMRKLGYDEGRNVEYEHRFAKGVPAQFPRLAKELVESKVRLILATGSTEAVAAAKATATIPIVGVHVGDPVELGLAKTLARPGRNFTGMAIRVPGYPAKQMELLVEAFPKARRFAILGNTAQPNFLDDRKLMEGVARKKGVSLLPTSEASRPEELDAAFQRVIDQQPDALMVPSLALFLLQRDRIIAFAEKAKLPALYTWPEDVESGGLIAYGVDVRALWGRAPVFIDKILKGEKPGDIPIEQPTRYGVWLNMKTARAIGVKFPPTILARGEALIE